MPQHRHILNPVYNGQQKDIRQVRRFSLTYRYRHRLHFFPMLLPLVEVVPLLLAGIGTLATAAGTIWYRRRMVLIAGLALGLIGFSGAGIMAYLRTPDKIVRHDGTKDIARAAYAKAVHYASLSQQRAAPPMENFGEVFTAQVKNPLLATPVVSNGVLVAGTYKNSAEGYDAATGEWLWTLPQAEPVFTIGKGAGDVVYIGEGLHHTRAAMLSALRMPSAEVMWQRQFLGHIESPPAVSPDGARLFLPAGGGGLWSVRAADGGVIWHAPVGHTDATPLLAGDTLYAAAQPDEAVAQSLFYALDAETGAVKWRVPLEGQPWGAPVMSADRKRIITTTGQGQIGVRRDTDRGWAMALSPEGGRILWKIDLPDMAIDPGDYLAAHDLALFTLKSGEIVAVDGRSGALRWQAKVGTEFMAAAIFIERGEDKLPLVAATSADGVFTIRDALSGKELRRRPVLTGASGAPVAEGDRIFVTVPYRIYAFGGIGSL
jgi:outer membrane protein assembly factor BamB